MNGRTRPRIHVMVPARTAARLRDAGFAAGIDRLVDGLGSKAMTEPLLEEIHTTVSDGTRGVLKRTASILGMPEGTVLWLLDEFGADHVRDMCRRRSAKS